MSEQCCCAHCRVVLKHTDNPNGTRSDYWICDYGCGQMFEPVRLKAEVNEQLKLASENMTTILPDGSALSVGTVMSKDEALKLPLKERPICFRLSSEMYHAVWEAIGAASMTFNKDAGNEVFNTEQVSKIAVELMFKIANEKEVGQLEAIRYGMERGAKMARDGWSFETILTAAKEFKL